MGREAQPLKRDTRNFQVQRNKNYCAFFAALAETALWTSSGLMIRLLATAFIWSVTLTHFRSCFKFLNLIYLLNCFTEEMLGSLAL